MTHRKSIDSVREEFENMLEAKTSWGRNEIKSLFERAVSNHYMSMADKAERVSEGSVLKKKVRTTQTTKTYSRALSGRKRLRKEH